MQSASSTISQIISTSTDKGISLTMEGILGYIDTTSFDKIIVTDKNSIVLYSTKKQDDLIGKKVIFAEVYNALNGKETFEHTFKGDYFEFASGTPIIRNNEIAGCVYMYRQAFDEAKLLSTTQKQILIFSFILCSMVMGISLFFSIIFTRQISVLTDGVKHINTGDYESKIAVATDDELGMLAAAFNNLTSKLSITDEKRKQFVSDASHELKTPLASIKLLVDSINSSPEMPKELLSEFLNDIGDEIDRLVRITEHLFILTRMDSDIVSTETVVDAKEELLKAVKSLNPIAKKRFIRLTYLTDDTCLLKGSLYSFSHIVYNLIDNAIKYNVDGGYVSVRLFNKEGYLYLIVKDNGIGIEKEDADKIFNRFYRVDKARTRETGGTGLGLSIVESNVLLLGGTIELESEIDKGSIFTVKIPVNI